MICVFCFFYKGPEGVLLNNKIC